MNKFPSASDMKKQTEKSEKKIIDSSTLKSLNKLFSVIEERSIEGEYELYTAQILTKSVQKALTSMGYSVSGDNGAYCEEAYWTISWE